MWHTEYCLSCYPEQYLSALFVMSTPKDATLTENANSVTPRLAPSENGSVAEKKGKWTAALHTLSDEERRLFKNLDAEKPALGILQDVLAATLKRKEDCLRKRRKVRISGREIVIRDVLDKLSAWVKKFIGHRTGICTNATANSCC